MNERRAIGSSHLGERTWPDLSATDAVKPLLVVPVGACEQHGPHLPLDTDTRLAVALCDGLVALASERVEGHDPPAAAALPLWTDLVVAPPLGITASGEHAGFPGTLSIGTDVMAEVLVELVRSADWAAGVILVNGHGGNASAVDRAVSRCTAEGRRVLAWWPRLSDADAHAGHTETSLMLAIAPHSVRLGRAVAGRLEPVAALIDDLRRDGIRSVSPNGVLGDPSGATASHGRSLLALLVDDLMASVDAWTKCSP